MHLLENVLKYKTMTSSLLWSSSRIPTQHIYLNMPSVEATLAISQMFAGPFPNSLTLTYSSLLLGTVLYRSFCSMLFYWGCSFHSTQISFSLLWHTTASIFDHHADSFALTHSGNTRRRTDRSSLRLNSLMSN